MKIPHPSRHRWLLLAAVTIPVLPLMACGARAGDPSDYPQRDIQVVVPYPAGSGIDSTTRALTDVVNDSGDLGQELQIVNRDGGGGTVGTTEVLNAKADGYTLGVVPDGPLTLVPQTEDVAYDPDKVTVINEVITSPIMFVVPADSPFKSLQDLVEAAEADASSITIGEGPLNYKVPTDAFEAETGAELKRVAFDGDQETTTALLGNNLDVGVMQLASALPQLSSGKLRALGVTADEAVDLIPGVATFKSQGVDIVWEAINLVVAPDDLPEDISKQLEEAFSDAMASEEFASSAEKLGLIVSEASPDETMTRLEEKTESAGDILADAE